MGVASLFTEKIGIGRVSRVTSERSSVEKICPVRKEIQVVLREMQKAVSPTIQILRKQTWEAIRPTKDGFALLRSTSLNGVQAEALKTVSLLTAAVKVECDSEGLPVKAAYLQEGHFIEVNLCKNCGAYNAEVLLSIIRTFKGAPQSHR